MQYLEFVNWSKIQPKDHGKPSVYCKLHARMLDDPRITQLTAAERGVLFSLLILRTSCGNALPFDNKWLAKRMQLRDSCCANAIQHFINCGIVLLITEPDNHDLPQELPGYSHSYSQSNSHSQEEPANHITKTTISTDGKYVYDGPSETQRKNNAHWLSVGSGKCYVNGCDLPAVTWNHDEPPMCRPHSEEWTAGEMVGRSDNLTRVVGTMNQDGETAA